MLEYHFPPIDLLKDSIESSRFQRLEFVQHLQDNLNGMYELFKVDAKVVEYKYNNFATLMVSKRGKGVTTMSVRRLRTDIELRRGNPVAPYRSGDCFPAKGKWAF